MNTIAVESAGSPVLVPDHTASLPEFRSPIIKDVVLQLDKIAVLGVVRVSKSPGESTAHGFVTGL